MEKEVFVSGYCRQLDSSRMVEVSLEDGKITECDCAWGTCPYETTCPVGQKIAALKENA